MIKDVLSDIRTEQLKEKLSPRSDMLTMCMSIDAKDMDIEQHPKRSLIKIEPDTSTGKSAFERLGKKVDDPKESVFQRLGGSVFDRLG